MHLRTSDLFNLVRFKNYVTHYYISEKAVFKKTWSYNFHIKICDSWLCSMCPQLSTKCLNFKNLGKCYQKKVPYSLILIQYIMQHLIYFRLILVLRSFHFHLNKGNYEKLKNLKKFGKTILRFLYIYKIFNFLGLHLIQDTKCEKEKKRKIKEILTYTHIYFLSIHR